MSSSLASGVGLKLFMKRNFNFFLIVPFLFFVGCWESNLAKLEPVKAFDIDFNWGEGGPNGFAKPGLWADATKKT